MKVLVIGGGRFIGLSTVERLLSRGHSVAVYNRGNTASALPAGAKHIAGDKQELLKQRDAIAAFGPEVIVDNICMTAADAERLMELARGIAQRVVVTSSCDVYHAFGILAGLEEGEAVPTPIAEDSPLREKRYPYRQPEARAADDPMRWLDDYDKILVEQGVLSGSLPATVLRLPMVYGPRDGQHRLYSYLRRMLDRRPAIVLSESTANWCNTRGFVENISEAFVLAAESQQTEGRIYNVAEESRLSEREWVARIAALQGWDGDLLELPEDVIDESLRGAAGLRQDLVIDSSRIRGELGYREAVDAETALRRTIEWESANPPAAWPHDKFDYELEDRMIMLARSAD